MVTGPVVPAIGLLDLTVTGERHRPRSRAPVDAVVRVGRLKRPRARPGSLELRPARAVRAWWLPPVTAPSIAEWWCPPAARGAGPPRVHGTQIWSLLRHFLGGLL